MAQADGRSGTRSKTRAATVTQRIINNRRCAYADHVMQFDGMLITTLAASAADHALAGKAGFPDAHTKPPRRLVPVGAQRTPRATLKAGAAEGARAALEIHLGKAALTGPEQTLRAGVDAAAAAIAKRGEQPLLQRPGRAHGAPPAAKIAAQKLRPADASQSPHVLTLPRYPGTRQRRKMAVSKRIYAQNVCV